MDLVGWTNDRRLPNADWVFGRPWYAAAALRTAVAEVGHHLIPPFTPKAVAS